MNNDKGEQPRKEKRVSSSSMDATSDSHYGEDNLEQIHVRRLSKTSVTATLEEEEAKDSKISDVPGLVVPKSLPVEDPIEIYDPNSTSLDENEDDDLEMQRYNPWQKEQEQAPIAVFVVVGAAVVFGAIFTILKMRRQS